MIPPSIDHVSYSVFHERVSILAQPANTGPRETPTGALQEREGPMDVS